MRSINWILAILLKISSVTCKTLWHLHLLFSKIIFTDEHHLCIFFSTEIMSQSRTSNLKNGIVDAATLHVTSGRLANQKKTHTVSVEVLRVNLL